jgi:lysophospholipase L1-like esterase
MAPRSARVTEAIVNGGSDDDIATGGTTAGAESMPEGHLARRTVLRFGTVAAAGAGAAALIPAAAARANAVTLDSIATPHTTVATTTDEAFGGCFVRPRSIERWLTSNKPIRHVVCVGDSITSGAVGGFNRASGGRGSWPEQLTTAIANAIGPNVGYGYRGLWLGVPGGFSPEWQASGSWTRTAATDPFDVCLFRAGYRSAGGPSTTLTWTRPTSAGPVAGFDLYWFNMAGAGNWQYKVDNGGWVNMGQPLTSADNKLHKFYVGQPVHNQVQIRAYNGSSACLAPIAGIGVYAVDPNSGSGVLVHNVGAGAEFLSNFVRSSSGDPLAWFDDVVSSPSSLAMQPDLVIMMFSNDMVFNNTAQWKKNVEKVILRVHPYADVLLMSPYEQSAYPVSVQTAYRSTTVSVTNAYRCALLDLYAAYAAAGSTGWAATNAAGLMLDGLHPSQLGHTDIAARVWRLLRTFS